MKQITFSRNFPTTHPKKGQPTYFVEKIWKFCCEYDLFEEMGYYEPLYEEHFPCQYTEEENVNFHEPKNHTIRAGKRWKVGEQFAPKVWTGKPYASPCLQFAPPLTIKKIWDIEFDINGVVSIDGYYPEDEEIIAKLAANDGLSEIEFLQWFSKLPFSGQIICWNEEIAY